ncbi:hypothetical protein BN871_DJ_00060 [Paenibacillus sp. P22]|nr:hypothetical protein BN871_DJ_00060 [Paenibacillus sp. P22]
MTGSGRRTKPVPRMDAAFPPRTVPTRPCKVPACTPADGREPAEHTEGENHEQTDSPNSPQRPAGSRRSGRLPLLASQGGSGRDRGHGHDSRRLVHHRTEQIYAVDSGRNVQLRRRDSHRRQPRGNGQTSGFRCRRRDCPGSRGELFRPAGREQLLRGRAGSIQSRADCRRKRRAGGGGPRGRHFLPSVGRLLLLCGCGRDRSCQMERERDGEGIRRRRLRARTASPGDGRVRVRAGGAARDGLVQRFRNGYIPCAAPIGFLNPLFRHGGSGGGQRFAGSREAQAGRNRGGGRAEAGCGGRLSAAAEGFVRHPEGSGARHAADFPGGHEGCRVAVLDPRRETCRALRPYIQRPVRVKQLQQRSCRHQRASVRAVSVFRRRRGNARLLADRGAQGASRGRPLVRRLPGDRLRHRPGRRHDAQPGVQRCRLREGDDHQGGRRYQGAGHAQRGQACRGGILFQRRRVYSGSIRSMGKQGAVSGSGPKPGRFFRERPVQMVPGHGSERRHRLHPVRHG